MRKVQVIGHGIGQAKLGDHALQGKGLEVKEVEGGGGVVQLPGLERDFIEGLGSRS